MAGVEDEDEFRDADDADATAPPPSSTSVSTPSKPKPAAAAAGFGRRLLASIPLPATFSAAIGRPSTPSSPKPPPPPASKVGLGLLLNPGREPSADSSDASAHNLHLPPTTALQQQHGEEVLEEQGTSVQRAHLALQHREDQVVGHDVGGVGEELVVLVPMEEECRLTAEGREKEGVADGCSANKNGFSLHDQEEGEQRTSVELGATMEDQDVVEQEGATKYYTAVEDQSNNAAEQCAGDAPRAFKDGNIVEDQEVVNQEGATKYYTAVEDHSNNAAEQCAGDAPRAIKDDNVVEDEEVVEQERATKYYSDVEDQSNNAAEQWAGDAPRAIKDDNVVEEKERAMEQGGPVGILCAAEDDIAVGSQEEEGVVVEGQGEDGISVLDQHKMVEQCMSDELGVAMGDSAIQDQEVVVVEQEEVTDYYDAVVEDQSNNAAVEQCTSDELRAVKDGNIVEEKEKAVEQEGAIGILGAAEDDVAVGSQEQEGEEEVVVVAEQGEDAISLQDHDKVVEQCSSDQLRTTTDDNAAQDHEVVEQEGAIVERGATVDGIAVETQEKAVEQSAGDESRATKDENAVEDKEKVVNQGVIDKQGAIKDGSAVEPQNEEDVVVAEQGEDGISVQDQDKVVEQCTSDQLRTTTDDNDAKDQEVSREKVRLSAGYPQRPGRPNCRFYMLNGSCSYGLSCYYNHPQLKAKPDVSSFPSEQGNREVAEFLELNRVGLPIREGARNCTYFMRNGTCRYGKKCCFNHPEQVLDAQLYMPTGWDDTNLPSSPHSKKSSEHAILDDLSSSSEFLPPNILRMLLPPQNVPPTTEEREMKVKKVGLCASRNMRTILRGLVDRNALSF
ncbi:uncharacterized protein LOC133890827 isoform X2 [Phragmites australis]|uniref:uncharacterized protein LOC133890827 isoform X2 n=1 Tax=Phragmites australis TaxID=29695 RepID=UPI002D7A0D9A|nr:uncharacterized protein LOC133890827 isoform X2 [Phragmites australis]